MPMPSKFTGTTQKKLLEARTVGAPQNVCAAVAGVDPGTLSRWLAKGREAKEPDSAYAEFYQKWQEATAHPKVRALGIIYRAMADKPELAMKYVERQVDGFAPPQPSLPAPVAGPVVIQIALNDGRPAQPITVIEGEVADVPNVSALPAPTD